MMTATPNGLNDLLFHNQTMLPRTSPGFGEISLAVAELQGGDPRKAAAFAEAAVAKDSTLAAGWLAKATADVYTATSLDLRTERAVFCLERALECAPSCRHDMTGFFVTQLLGYYVGLLCAAARAQVDESKRVDAAGSRASDEAALLGHAALAASFTAFCARRYETKVISGITAAVAYAEKERHWEQSGLLHDTAACHGAAAVFHLPPVHQLLRVSAQMLRAENLSLDLLNPGLENFARTCKEVCADQLKRLRMDLELSLWRYIRKGESKSLREVYALASPSTAERSAILGGWKPDEEVLNTPYPPSRPLLFCLNELLPEVRRTTAYELLTSPYNAAARAQVAPVAAPVRVVDRTIPITWDKEAFDLTNQLAGCGLLLGVLAILLGIVSLCFLYSPDEAQGLSVVVSGILLAAFLGVVGWLLIRWCYPRWQIAAAKARANRQRIQGELLQRVREKKQLRQEARRLAKETEQRISAPREQLAALVSASYQSEWGGEKHVFPRSESLTMWSLETWMGNDLAVRLKAALLPPTHLPALPASPPLLPNEAPSSN